MVGWNALPSTIAMWRAVNVGAVGAWRIQHVERGIALVAAGSNTRGRYGVTARREIGEVIGREPRHPAL